MTAAPVPGEDATGEGDSLAADLDASVAGVREQLAAANAARERALPLCRGAVRHAANSIRAIHRDETALAEDLLAQSGGAVREAAEALRDFPSVLYAGFVHDAQKEYAEAAITLALVDGRALPSPEALEVTGPAYLHGLSETVGELRRYLLDMLRRGAVEDCERTLRQMDDIYALLVTVDYPDAMTGNLRRSTDAARAILERTRGDLTLAVQQERLAQRLEGFERSAPDAG